MTYLFREKESNLRSRVQSPLPYHLAIPERGNTPETVGPDFLIAESDEQRMSQVLSKSSLSSAISQSRPKWPVIVSRVMQAVNSGVRQALATRTGGGQAVR